jgi:hypothetical protein
MMFANNTAKFLSYSLSNFKYFQILIDGIRGNGYQGDIAIDDLTFTQTKWVGTLNSLNKRLFRT